MDIKAQKTSFTLIELLVVISSVAMVAAIMLPAFAGTRQSSQVVQCLANQRQLTAAWMMYAGDNNDVLVPNRGLNGQSPLTPSENPLLDPRLRPGGQCADWCPGNIQSAAEVVPGNYPGGSKYSWWIEAGLLYPYIKNINVYHCPADHSIVPRSGGPFTAPALRTYSMNCWVQPMDAPGYATATYLGISGYLAYTKLSDMTRPGPGKTWVFIEENQYSVDDAFFAIDPTHPVIWPNLPAVLHGNASVLAFADGHADTRRWTDKNMINDVNPQVPPGGNVPADPSSSDLHWLLSASTVVK